MKTLTVQETVGSSLVGTAAFPNYAAVEIGKMGPAIRTSEDPEGLVRAGFLDPTAPAEFNLGNIGLIRSRMLKLGQAHAAQPWGLNPGTMLRGRPSIGYVPPEFLTNPNDKAITGVARNGGPSAKIAELRQGNPDGRFWVEAIQSGAYMRWIRQLITWTSFMGAGLMPVPAPVVTRDVASSGAKQGEVVRGVIAALERQPVPGDVGLMYPLHLHPSALHDDGLVDEALAGLRTAVTAGDNPFWGVHVHFTDPDYLGRDGDRIAVSKGLVRKASQIAKGAGMFTWVSDVGPVGPVFLDYGAAFTSYQTGLTPRKIWGGGAASGDAQWGKAISIWEYRMLSLNQIERRGWQLEDTGLFPHEVPLGLRNSTPKPYRVGWAKPQNVAVMDRMNELRAQELAKGHTNPGHHHLGKSGDPKISPWAPAV